MTCPRGDTTKTSFPSSQNPWMIICRTVSESTSHLYHWTLRKNPYHQSHLFITKTWKVPVSDWRTLFNPRPSSLLVYLSTTVYCTLIVLFAMMSCSLLVNLFNSNSYGESKFGSYICQQTDESRQVRIAKGRREIVLEGTQTISHALWRQPSARCGR